MCRPLSASAHPILPVFIPRKPVWFCRSSTLRHPPLPSICHYSFVILSVSPISATDLPHFCRDSTPITPFCHLSTLLNSKVCRSSTLITRFCRYSALMHRNFCRDSTPFCRSVLPFSLVSTGFRAKKMRGGGRGGGGGGSGSRTLARHQQKRQQQRQEAAGYVGQRPSQFLERVAGTDGGPHAAQSTDRTWSGPCGRSAADPDSGRGGAAAGRLPGRRLGPGRAGCARRPKGGRRTRPLVSGALPLPRSVRNKTNEREAPAFWPSLRNQRQQHLQPVRTAALGAHADGPRGAGTRWTVRLIPALASPRSDADGAASLLVPNGRARYPTEAAAAPAAASRAGTARRS